jgi:hypothetical protein
MRFTLQLDRAGNQKTQKNNATTMNLKAIITAIGIFAILGTTTSLAATEEAKSDRHKKPEFTNPATAKPEDFKLPYEATKNTEWSEDINKPHPKTGTVKKGTKVFFDHIPNGLASWQTAKFEDGTFRLVRPNDYKKL